MAKKKTTEEVTELKEEMKEEATEETTERKETEAEPKEELSEDAASLSEGETVSFKERRDHRILERLSKAGTGGAIFGDQEDVLEEGKADEELLKRCMKAKESGSPLLFAFQYADKDGTLIGRIGGVEFFLKSEDFSVSAPYYNARNKNFFLNVPISVKVGEVDEAGKKVTFLSSRDGRTAEGKERVRAMAVKALHGCLDRGETPRVWGRVTLVSERGYARVLLFDEVSAEISVANWRRAYTRSLPTLCRKDAIYEFDVIGTRKVDVERTETSDKRHSSYEVFTLSRLEIEPNPFDVVKEKNVQPGDVVCVKCQEIPDPTFATKNYFYGTCDRLRGVEICARIGGNPDIQYKVGLTYNCKIRGWIERRGVLIASAFEYAKESKDAVIKFL